MKYLNSKKTFTIFKLAIIAFILFWFGHAFYRVINPEGEFLRVFHCVNKYKNIPNGVRYLRGFNVNSKSHHSDSTPLTMFSKMGDVPAVKMLLAAGADKSMVNLLGRTALDEAKLNGHVEVCQLLEKEEENNGKYQLKTKGQARGEHTEP